MNIIIITESFPLGRGTEEAFVIPDILAALEAGHRVIVMPVTDRGPVAPSFPASAVCSRCLCDSIFLRNRWLRPLLWPSSAFRRGSHGLSRYALAAEAVRRPLGCFIKANSLSPADTRILAFWFDFPSSALIGIGIPYSIRAHGYDLHIPSATSLRRATLLNANAIFPASNYAAGVLAELFPDVHDKIHVAPLGSFIPPERDVHAPDGAVNFVSVSRVVESKRVNIALDLIAALALARPGWQFTWTHFGDGPLFEPLRRRAEKAMSGLPNLKITLTGWLDHPELERILDSRRFTFGIHTSSTEGGIPLGIVEMMARGIPVVAADCGGISQAVDDETGILLPADPDPDLFIGGLLPFLDSKSRYKKLSSAARRRVADSLDASVLRANMISILADD